MKEKLGVIKIGKSRHEIEFKEIDKGAIAVINRLRQEGFKAYIVGGSIRDLLRGEKPKDFDIVTCAEPKEIKTIFRRNAILIGKRFQIAYVFWGKKRFEVTTFRRPPHESESFQRDCSTFLKSDNFFSDSLADDALRRDITINAFYYDPLTETILDYTEGFKDFFAKRIRVIGDPYSRFAEDPIRILRVLKIATKLNFRISKETLIGLRGSIPFLKALPGARLSDYIRKTLACGYASKVFLTFEKEGINKFFWPELYDQLSKNNLTDRHREFVYRTLIKSDQRIKDGNSISPILFFASLGWTLLEQNIKRKPHNARRKRKIVELGGEILSQCCQIISIPKFLREKVIGTWVLQIDLEAKQKRLEYVLGKVLFRHSLRFLIIRAEGDPSLQPLLDFWLPFYDP